VTSQNETLEREQRCKEFLAQQSDVDLAAMYDDLMGQIVAGYREAERQLGMTLAEAALARAQEGNCVGLFSFPTAGKNLRDFFPPGYDGEVRARRGEILLELMVNVIPVKLLLERKVEIARAQTESAMRAPDLFTVPGLVRSAVALAVWKALEGALAERNDPKPPERPKARERLLEAVFGLIKFTRETIERHENGGRGMQW
jgi:hypothetical protein